MEKPYFVMLRHPGGEYFLPLVDDDDECIQFETAIAAHAGARDSSLGSDCGYEIFDFREGL